MYISKRAKINEKSHILNGAIVLGDSEIGSGVWIDSGVIVGYPTKKKVSVACQFIDAELEKVDELSEGAIIEENTILRSGTTVYERVEIGKSVQTGHHVLIREDTIIGDHTIIGSGSIIDGNVEIGEEVSIQSGVYLPPKTIIKRGVFIGPGVIFTNDRYPPSGKLIGAYVEEEAVIGAGSKILAGVRIGRGAVIGMGSVIVRDVESNTVVAGVPAKKIGTRENYESKKRKYAQKIN
ncbi:N-acetyltransferase [Candidatus Bathyarchaeota archaeon ex4484_205]|nr:MAG: N-acetyltransferase [Candidatus Bathyarchaeota archaeon ex4484_205]